MKKETILITAITVLAVMVPAAAKETASQAEFRSEDVRINVNINSSIYTYRVTNLGVAAINQFEVKQHNAYGFVAPAGWQKEAFPDAFRAWTDDTEKAIGPTKTGEFSLRVSSKGAVLGFAPVKIKLASGKMVVGPDVWVPVPEPKSYIALVAGLVIAITSVHTVVIHYKDKRQKTVHINDV